MPTAAGQHGDRELRDRHRRMRSAVIVFPGSNCDRDVALALRQASGRRPTMIWHRETELPPLDLIVVPGGFSYGDYLRCGAIAARSPVMRAVKERAAAGVLGARHLQRLPGADRGRAAAGRAAAQRRAALRLQGRLPARRERSHAVHPRLPPGPGGAHADRPQRRQLLRRRRDAGPAARRGPGRLPLLRRRGRGRTMPPTRTARSTASPASSTSAATCSG